MDCDDDENNSYSHSTKCCRGVFHDVVDGVGVHSVVKKEGMCNWKYAKYGETVFCGGDQIVFGRCAGGANSDCGPNRQDYHGICCADFSVEVVNENMSLKH